MAPPPIEMFGPVPMCHGTGGLAAHFRFGARTDGAAIMIGIFFVFVDLLIAGIALVVPNLSWALVIGIGVDLFIEKMKIVI